MLEYPDLLLLNQLGIVDDIQDDMYLGFSQGSISHAELLEWVTLICDKYGIENWTLNSEGLVDVDGSVDLEDMNLIRLPLRFGRVSVSFGCCYNKLTTLEGAPQWVGGNFDCSNNYLTTLEGGPNLVGGYFYCNINYLTTLEGAPLEVGKSFSCFSNELTTLEGAPLNVGRDFYCENNQLTSLDGIGEVKGCIYNL